jgi:Polyglycine hydrolase-like, structural repeat
MLSHGISLLAFTLFVFVNLTHADPPIFIYQDVSSPDEIAFQLSGETSIPAWRFYYGVDSATHQDYFNSLSPLGYRMISLSSYGSPSAAQYAAVWVQRPGPLYWAIHGADGPNYQKWFDTHSAEGYVSTI